ncbi:unnamed protein product, partial [Mesorhabditis belari]|uniref:Uncharacterized protein n=1 Tax=Mesorhabditis belari TaxID=2138241 RepID=A0AAF3E909_9BILA
MLVRYWLNEIPGVHCESRKDSTGSRHGRSDKLRNEYRHLSKWCPEGMTYDAFKANQGAQPRRNRYQDVPCGDARRVVIKFPCDVVIRVIGLLFVVGEGSDHIGMIEANKLQLQPHFLVVGEPTENRFASIQKEAFKFVIKTTGKAGHSGYPRHNWKIVLQHLVWPLLMMILIYALPILLILFAVGCGRKKTPRGSIRRPKASKARTAVGNEKLSPASLVPLPQKGFFFAEKSCKSGKKASETKETSEEEILPKPIHRTEKAEAIVRKSDYPTFNDILSDRDWESKSKQSASRKSEMKLDRDLKKEKKENLAD